MSKQPGLGEHVSQYERAVCYYTLPRVTRPLTYGLIVAYAFCIAEALAAAAFGVLAQNRTWTVAGAACLVAMIVFGMVVFTVRTFLNDLRQRRALAEARAVPDAMDSDLPDPFADHVLLRHPRDDKGSVFTCAGENADVEYRVKQTPAHRRRAWTIETPDASEICQVRLLGGPPSFSFGGSAYGNLLVSRDGEELARITTRGFSFTSDRTDVRILKPVDNRYRIERRCIYHEDRLVGRIYYVRRSLYLDIEEAHFNLGILAYYVVAL